MWRCFVTRFNCWSKAALSAQACLSYSCKRSKNHYAILTFLAPYQSLFSPSKMQTPSNTMTTAGGGFAKPLISVISFLLSFFRASAAALRAGMALLSSDWASSAIILIYCCSAFTNSPCYWNTASPFEAYLISTANCFKNSSVLIDCSASFGFKIVI